MSERAIQLLRVMATISLAVVVVGAVITADPPQTDRAEAIGSRIRCPVCQGESIADSPSGLARDMMALVRQRVDEGYSDEQVIDEILASYSEAQHLDPPLRASTVALWAIPAVALVAGAVVVASRRRRDPFDQAGRQRGSR